MKKKKRIKELEELTHYLDARIIELEHIAFVASNAECSRVQLNSTQGHTKDKTAPDAQQNEQDDTKIP
jgi:hypothetical protein